MVLPRSFLLRFCAVLPLSGIAACAQTDAPPATTQAENAEAARKTEEPEALPTLHDMIGLDHEQVTALLGAPTFRRLDTPADLWQYGNRECILDLFLYRVRNGTAFKVTHADVRTVNDTTLTKDACFKGLIKKHHIKQAG
jgi:hypothetical protein